MFNIFRFLIFIITIIFLIGSNARAGLANPDLLLNFLTLYQNSSRDNVESNGFTLQEAEILFFSDVDPYFRVNALFSIYQASPTSEFGIEPEEVFVETTNLPNVTFKIGKFKAALNRQNLMHTHALPFIDSSLIDQQLVGDGLNEAGISAALLLPAGWFSELTIQALQGENEILFNSPNRRALAILVHSRNLWDLSDDLTLDWGVTGSGGNNSYNGYTQVYASDLTFKWRPETGGKYKSLIWSSEYLCANLQGNPAGENMGGFSSWIQYQFAERWWVQGRFDYAGSNPEQKKESLLLGYFPSEFSGFRIQYDRLSDGLAAPENKISLQMNVTIGAHPAHSY